MTEAPEIGAPLTSTTRPDTVRRCAKAKSPKSTDNASMGSFFNALFLGKF
jgi:hypothetical protein